MNLPFRKITIALFFLIALVAAFLVGFMLLTPNTQVLASPVALQNTTPTAPEATPTEVGQGVVPSSTGCGECHPAEQQEWYQSAHSIARTDHVLEQASNCNACHPQMLEGQMVPPGMTSESTSPSGRNCVACHTTGYNAETNTSKSYGITCEACHSPIPTGHGENPGNNKVPTYTGTDLCASCHSDTRFDWSSWKESKHYQQFISCVECHSPHSTSLKYVSAGDGNKSTLCLKCHETATDMSPYSVHGRAGVTCEQCHLGDKKGPDTFHVVPNHSFEVQIETCKKCHAEDIHRAQEPGADVPAAVSINATPTPYVAEEEEKPASGTSGSNVSVMLLAGLMVVIGLVIGIAVSARFKNTQPK